MPIVIGALFILLLLIKYGVNTPFWDEWDLVSLLKKIDQHTLSISDLWQTHNEHRIFFPWILLLLMAKTTHWHTGAPVLLGLVIATITLWIMLGLLKQGLKTKQLQYIAAIFLACWFFSPVQWQNWTWGGQIEWFMCNLAAVTTVYLIFRLAAPNKNQKTLFFGALISAFISTFSLASGMFVWVIGLAALLFTRANKKLSYIWATAMLISAGLYYLHFVQTPSPEGPVMNVFIHHPLRFLEFFIALMGGPVGSLTGGGLQTAIPGGLQLAVIVGAVMLALLPPVLYVLWSRRKYIQAYLPWLLLVTYALLCALSTAFGRLGYGIDLVFKSRYTSFTLLYVIGISALIFVLIDHSRISFNTKRLLALTFILVMAPILLSSYVVGIKNFQNQSALLRDVKNCTHEQNPADSCLVKTYPKPNIVRPRLEYVKQKHLAGY
jgi:ABC-2 type transport system permease protein